MRVLAIETSMDETAVAVVESTQSGLVRVVSEGVASSAEMHVATGGVVPEVAAREQVKVMVPVLEQTLKKAFESNKQQVTSDMEILRQSGSSHPARSAQDDESSLKSAPASSNTKYQNGWARENIDAIAVTYGPGMVGSLLVGIETAKTLALAWDKPLIPVNHMRGHLFANWIMDSTPGLRSEAGKPRGLRLPEFPAVGLVVSGGHTDLVLMKSEKEIELIGTTRDDAAGECFDKCARVLGLAYPGGPEVAKAASKHQATSTKSQTIPNIKNQISKIKIDLPRPLLREDTYDMSFSGLKIAVKRTVNNKQKTENREQKTENNEQTVKNAESGMQNRLDEEFVGAVCYELQEAVVEVLVEKTMRAVKEYRPKSLLLSGGVAANQRLRESVERRASSVDVPLFVPELKYCTDNAVMVGAAAVLAGVEVEAERVSPNPVLEITD